MSFSYNTSPLIIRISECKHKPNDKYALPHNNYILKLPSCNSQLMEEIKVNKKFEKTIMPSPYSNEADPGAAASSRACRYTRRPYFINSVRDIFCSTRWPGTGTNRYFSNTAEATDFICK